MAGHHGLPAIVLAALLCVVGSVSEAELEPYGGYPSRFAVTGGLTDGTCSDMLRHDPAGPRIRTGLDIDRPEVAVVDVLQRHGHHFGLAVDVDTAEKLQAETGREILALALQPFWNIAFGPNVLSSGAGAQVPACSGPETNSQNGSKS